MDKRRKQLKPLRKGKSKKRAKDGGKWRDKRERRCPGPTQGEETEAIICCNSSQSAYDRLMIYDHRKAVHQRLI